MAQHLLLAELRSKYGFPDEEFPKLLAFFREKRYKKNEIIFKAGEVVKYAYFIMQGCIRQYYVSPEGSERTIYFAEEGSFCGEMMSFLHSTPTNLHLQALEDSDVIYMNLKDWEKAITTI